LHTFSYLLFNDITNIQIRAENMKLKSILIGAALAGQAVLAAQCMKRDSKYSAEVNRRLDLIEQGDAVTVYASEKNPTGKCVEKGVSLDICKKAWESATALLALDPRNVQKGDARTMMFLPDQPDVALVTRMVGPEGSGAPNGVVLPPAAPK
jgi:hypothetical protein